MSVVMRKPGTPLLTVEEVDAWREELRQLKTQQEEANARIRDLEARLAAADFFMRDHTTHKLVATSLLVGAPETKQSAPPTMQEAVLRIIRKNPEGMEPKQISNVIRVDPDMPSRIKNAHPNYIYTVLMRMLQQGTLEKDGALYKLRSETVHKE